MSRPRLLVVAHDAGGAEIVSSWLARHLRDWEPAVVLGGPAVAIFARKLGEQVPRSDDLPRLDGVAFVLCGSSAAAPLERLAVRATRAAGVRCAVWLDHWTNYIARFVTDGALILPDEVWVADAHAAALARAELPDADVQIMGNPYLEDFATDVRALETVGRSDRSGGGRVERILYVTEPTAAAAERATGDPRGWGYTEHEALIGYVQHLARRESPPVQLRLRTHPSEPPDKYEALLAQYGATLELRGAPGSTLVQDVAWADTVVGCETMAMVAALAAGRRVVSTLPSGVGPLSLPCAGIERHFS